MLFLKRCSAENYCDINFAGQHVFCNALDLASTWIPMYKLIIINYIKAVKTMLCLLNTGVIGAASVTESLNEL